MRVKNFEMNSGNIQKYGYLVHCFSGEQLFVKEASLELRQNIFGSNDYKVVKSFKIADCYSNIQKVMDMDRQVIARRTIGGKLYYTGKGTCSIELSAQVTSKKKQLFQKNERKQLQAKLKNNPAVKEVVFYNLSLQNRKLVNYVLKKSGADKVIFEDVEEITIVSTIPRSKIKYIFNFDI